MIITWYGQSCFRIESRETVIAIDPFAKNIGLTPPRFRADMLLITHQHPDHAASETIQGEPMVINGPGEYEVRGVGICGIQTFHDASAGKERGTNTAYVIAFEDIRICHLGDFGEESVREETAEELGDVDILMLPVGGVFTIGGKTAAHIVSRIEPRIVIPMHYKIPGLSVPLDGNDSFLKEMGTKGAEDAEKLTIKKKDLPVDETQVIVLKPHGA